MTIKLTDRERKLIEVILKYEKGHVKLSNSVASAFGMIDMDSEDLVPFEKVARSIGLEPEFDLTAEIIYGYVRGRFDILTALDAIEFFLNDEYAKAARLVSFDD